MFKCIENTNTKLPFISGYYRFKQTIKKLGGEIQHEYNLIKGFSIKLPKHHFSTLEKDEHVNTIEEDQVVKANSV